MREGSGAANYAVVLMGESPIGRNCPVAAIVISSGGKGDQPAGSLEVKVSVGRATRSDPPREASKRAGCSKSESGSPEIEPHVKRIVGVLRMPSVSDPCEG